MPRPSPATTRLIVIGLASASFGLLGGCMTLAGALLPLLLDELHLSLMDAGSLLAFQPIGFIVAVMVAGRLIRTLGLATVLTMGIGIAALGFAAFGAISSWTAGALAMLLAGIGVGTAEVAANAAVLTVERERANKVLNFVHLFFGIGSFLTPLLATRAIDAGASWRAAFVVVAALTALIGLSWWFVHFEPTREARQDELPVVAASGARAVWLLAITLGLYVGTEMGLGNWISKYLVAQRGAALSEAGMVLSVYWFGLAAGRLLLSLLPARAGTRSDETMLVVLSGVATLSLLIAVTSDSFVITAICFAFTGLGFSGIFPGVIALGGQYQPHAVAAATSTIITGAGIGNIVIPWMMSAVADNAGLDSGMYVYTSMSAAMFVAAVLVRRQAPPHVQRA